MADTPISPEKYALIVQKATIFDLLRLIDKEPNRAYTAKELEKLLIDYLESQKK